jgi:hypothetical protein
MINIEDLTIGQARQLAALFSSPTAASPVLKPAEHPFEIGKLYFIRTVTHHHTGRLVDVTPTELVLTDAAWIAEDGRLTDALMTGSFSEVEMFPTGSRVIVGRGSIIDALVISTLPTSQK